MLPPKHVVIIAGEESGDVHGARLIRQLKQSLPDLKVSGIGGQHLEAAGVELISHLAKHGVTGITEVLRHIRIIRRAFLDIKQHLKDHKPDLLLLVDYPGFNLRLAKFAKKQLGLRIVYFISPQIWAWKPNRIHTIKASVDHMAVILPFEKVLYEKAKVPVSFVGHPLIENLPKFSDISALKTTLGLPQDKRLVALLPGSRQSEIAHHMPTLAATMALLVRKDPSLHFVIPVALTLDLATIAQYAPQAPYLSLIPGEANAVIACSDCIVVASGTASLECALAEKPMCIIYKVSLFTFIFAMQVIRTRYLGLCNLLADKMIVPELLQYDCNPEELALVVERLLYDEPFIARMRGNLALVKGLLQGSLQEPVVSLEELVVRELK